MYGSNLVTCRVLEFVLLPGVAKVWYRGLRRLVRTAHLLRRKQSDRRALWLKDQYLQLYYENDRKHGPTPAQAIKVKRTSFTFFSHI